MAANEMSYPLVAYTWEEAEVAAMTRVIESRQFTMSSEVANFEEKFAAYHGTAHGIMVNSGSSANLISVASLFFKAERPLLPGDEVIVPALSWATTYHPLQQYGLRLRFVDIDPETLNIDTSKLRDALTDRTRLIVPVSILGNPAELEEIRRFADEQGLYVLEDNCESLGARTPTGKLAGTFGDLNTFSFFFSHHVTTMEGGLVLTDSDELAELLRALRAHGWTRDLREPPSRAGNKAGDASGIEQHFEAYRFVLPGYNVRPTEMAGAVGSVQLEKLNAMIALRRRNLKIFQELFGDDHRFHIQREHGLNSSFCFPIVLNPALSPDRSKLFQAFRDAEIEFRIITGGCFTRHPVIRYYDYEIVGDLKHAEEAHDFGFFLGNFPMDLTKELTLAHEVLDKALG
jgi:CDP-4-dehydro-6-deoxyglucose reductase, E1